MNENNQSRGPQQQGGRGRSGRGRSRRGGGGGGGGVASKSSNDANQNERQRLYSECSEDHCAVCLNRLVIFAVGRCNHPVCGECSTRMRILCTQNECPICRQDLPKVFHTNSRQRYEDIENNVYPMDRKAGICFETDRVQARFNQLLEHRCPVCDDHDQKFEDQGGGGEKQQSGEEGGGRKKPAASGRNKFSTFRQLDKHVRQEHDLYYCDLCTGHLKSFTHERRLYTRQELATHRRKGDPDDTSHRGHPLCQFCEARFVDNDELFRHLRRDHFFCHFCDMDGSHLYFHDYNKLRDHFREEHFLCEDGNCVNEQFTSAFRSEIDIKAHRIERHSGGLSKAATKLNRTVDVELNFSRPMSNNQVGRRRGLETEQYDQTDGTIRNSASEGRLPDMAADFPSLEAAVQPVGATGGGGSSANLAKRVASSSGLNWSSSRAGAAFHDQDFPSLPGGPKASSSSQRPPQQQQQQFQKPAPKPVPKPAPKREPDFPSLGSDNRRAGSDNLLSNFRAVDSTPQYRNLPGQTPVWQQSQPVGASVQVVPAETLRKSDSGTKVNVPLKKGKEAPAPFEEDFPDLGPSSGNIQSESSGSKNGAKKKNKNKSKNNGFTIGDELITSAEPAQNHQELGARLKGTSNLQSAADLIFMEKKISGSGKKGKNNNSGATTTEPKQSSENGANQSTSSKNDQNKSKKVETVKEEQPQFNLVRPSKLNPTVEKPSKPVQKQVLPTTVEQFPSLGASASKISSNFVPVKTTATPSQSSSTWNGKAAVMTQLTPSKGAPPPGFQNPVPAAAKKPAPPPGFKAPAQVYRYQEPSNFAGRNQKLLSDIMALIGGKSVEFDRFKSLSSRFRSGGLTSEVYHSECLNLIERPTFEKFFPQLLALLPDISKQTELFELHNKKFPDSALPLSKCKTCSQVLLLVDVNEHENFHGLDQDFPLLSLK